MSADALRAEAWQRDYAARASVVASEVRKRKEAEAEVLRLRTEVDFLWALLEGEHRCDGQCYRALLP